MKFQIIAEQADLTLSADTTGAEFFLVTPEGEIAGDYCKVYDKLAEIGSRTSMESITIQALDMIRDWTGEDLFSADEDLFSED
jgi:hypothetical protein